MLGSIIAERYAKALFEIALEANKLEEIRNDMLHILEVINKSKEFKQLLISPVFRPDKKINVMDSIFAGKTEALTRKFYQLIVQKRREKYLHGITLQFIEKYKLHHNIVTLELRSVIPVEEYLQKEIIELIEKRRHMKVELIEVQDENLIGGFIISSKDQRYDASLKSAIRKLKKEYEQNLYLREI